MIYKVVGSRRVAHVAPGAEVSDEQIAAAGGSVSHLLASGHIAPLGQSGVTQVKAAEVPEPPQVASGQPVVKASKKAASTTIPVDEADNEETQ
jgi:hypothetical protein